MLIYVLTLMIFLLGLYCVVAKKNIIKIIIGLIIMEYSIRLFLIILGWKKGGVAPVIIQGVNNSDKFVDPLPQALIVTAIVIGLSVLALAVVIAIRIYEKYKTFDITKINKLKG